jgi:sugar/nucleoside kinase (ribokinase family)
VPAYDYTTVGHVTADVFSDGTRRPGGGAFYSALQAARLGQRALIITQGVPSELEELLAPYRAELELEIRPAGHTTTLHTRGRRRGERTQRVLAWAGPIEGMLEVDTAILHLAPVARETAPTWSGHAEFVGLTPQGLVRAWSATGEQIYHRALAPEQLPERWDAIVISRAERDSFEWLITAAASAAYERDVDGADAGAAGGAVMAITAAADATVLHVPGAGTLELEVPRIEQFVDDIGAGDVFAAAFFHSLQRGCGPPEAAAFANAAAAVRIGGAGPAAVGERGAIQAQLRALA